MSGVYTNIVKLENDLKLLMRFGQLKYNIEEWKQLKINESWKRIIRYQDGSNMFIEIKKIAPNDDPSELYESGGDIYNECKEKIHNMS